jgi:hypothetical protein
MPNEKCSQCGSKFKHAENCLNKSGNGNGRINHMVSDERLEKWVQALKYIQSVEELDTSIVPNLKDDLQEVRNR